MVSDTTQKRIAIAIAIASDETTMQRDAIASKQNGAARRENRAVHCRAQRESFLCCKNRIRGENGCKFSLSSSAL
jgi:hypothetical protein